MGIANELEFSTIDDLSFEIEIITQPGELDQVSFKNGVFWIEYSSETNEVEEVIEEKSIAIKPTPKAISE